MIRIIIFYCKIKQNYRFVYFIVIGELFFLFVLWEIAPLPSFALQLLEGRRPKPEETGDLCRRRGGPPTAGG